MLRPKSRHSDARGQVLVAALVFIAFFALVGGATIAYISSVHLQHTQVENATWKRALVEGAAAYAVADLSRPGASLCSTSSPTSGSVNLGSGETFSYTVPAAQCFPGGNGPGVGSGISCFLCVLTSTAGAVVFDGNKSNVTVTAPPGVPSTYIDAMVNQNATVEGAGGYICARKPTDAAGVCSLTVGLAGTSNGSPPPASIGPGGSATVHVAPVADPLASMYTPPSLAGPDNLSVTSAGSILPGIYDTINITNGTLTLAPGTYVITQSLQSSGSGIITGTGVTIYLACNNGPGKPVACSPSAPATSATAPTTCSGTTNRQAYIALDGSPVAAGTYHLSVSAPSSGPYTNLALFADRNNAASMCTTGNGNASINGIIYGKSYGLDIEGNGIASVVSNLVIGAIEIKVSSTGNGLKLGAAGAVTPIACELVDASVTGTKTVNGILYTEKGRVLFQTGCSGGPGVIALTYPDQG